MFYTLYMVLVLATNPTIPADVKALGDDQFKEREAAIGRLEALPGWTALFFKHHAGKKRELEVRMRCATVYEKLDSKWRADLILAIFPTIPADIEALGDRQYKVREAATKRLESLPGLPATYFRYFAAKSADPEVRSRCERMCEKLDLKWRSLLGALYLGFQWEIARAEARRGSQELKATIVDNLAKLSTEDLKLAVAQGSCPIREAVPLGGMGVPVKIMLNGQPVLLCCKECIKDAQANPNKTLAKVKERKENPLWYLRRFLTKEQLQNLKETPNFSKNKNDRAADR